MPTTTAPTYATIAQMRTMGMNVPDWFSTFAKGGDRRGFRVSSRRDPRARGGGDHAARRYHVGEAQRLIDAYDNNYRADEPFTEKGVTWWPAPLLEEQGRFVK